MPDATPEPLKIVADRQGPATVIALVGAADIDQGESLRRQIRQAAAEGDPVVLDLQSLTFISSTWLGVFIQLYKDCRDRGASVRIARPSRRIQQILQTTRLTSIMPVSPTLEGAIEQA